MFKLFVESQEPTENDIYTGSAFSADTGNPNVNPADRPDFLEGVPGTAAYDGIAGVPNYLDVQSTGVQATAGVGGWPGDPEPVWYDSLRPNAGYPLPVPVENGVASQYESSNDFAAIAANEDFGIDDFYRFGQPDLNPTNSRITERTFDVPVEWKAQPTFPAQIQKIRPWDRVMGAWPWKGTKDAVPVEVSPPNYYAYPLPNGIPSPAGAAGAMVPNTPSLSPQPLTWRVMPQQWDDDYVYSGV